ncbi:hypothetical protein ACE2AJ_17040 [Aquihabitans daechungensis]|uniref:hypothetical protein n=1 Tax=Aquihabitans daechungensis TaxID=1052257 RepID=UPI003B9E00C4
MTDDLRRAMEVEAGPGTPPEVGGLWRTGRRRRSARRWAAAGGSLVAVVLVAGVGVRLLGSDDAESVRSSGVPATCDPRPVSQSEFLLSAGDAPWSVPPQAPRTAVAMVRGGGSEHLLEPDVVARVRVLDAHGATGMGNERRSEVEVVESVLGAKVGDRLTISDLGAERRLREIEAATKQVKRRIAEAQAAVNEIYQPLADMDERIYALPPTDPAYAALIAQRETLKQQLDRRRNAAQNQLNDLQQRLQVLQLSERLSSSQAAGTACHRFAVGDDLIVALVQQGGSGRYELTGPSSFFLVDGDGFSEELDAARRSVADWGDSPLLELARRSSPDEFLDDLRQAADD